MAMLVCVIVVAHLAVGQVVKKQAAKASPSGTSVKTGVLGSVYVSSSGSSSRGVVGLAANSGEGERVSSDDCGIDRDFLGN